METLPAWNNTQEYEALDSKNFQADWAQAESLIRRIQELNSNSGHFEVEVLQKISELKEQAGILLSNLGVYINCEMSLDSLNARAAKLNSRLTQVRAQFENATTPSKLFLIQCDEETLSKYLGSPHTKSERFYWKEERKRRNLLLSKEQEILLTRFRAYGLKNWGELYNQICGTLRVQVSAQGEMGVAQAEGLLRQGDEQIRKNAWHGVQEAWKTYEYPIASVLNNLAGYRLEEYQVRSHTTTLDFLDEPLRQSRIERATLDALMNSIQESRPLLKRALKAMASCQGKDRLDPWDLLAPVPQKNSSPSCYPFSESQAMVTQAFASVEPAMGDFVSMMIEKGWVDSRVLPNKRSGAFCTGFMKSRTPRVFQTYLGSFQDTSTLAHELGHAWHGWLMRDLPLAETFYPMTLAETASIFAECALADYLFATAESEAIQFEIAYAEVSDAVSFLVNIPTRFDFERSFYQARAGGALTPKELGDLMEAAYRKNYGEELSQTERQFWMTKLHFSIAGVSFYNFPYTFGYLFSLGIYAQKAIQGAHFAEIYRGILRDTGRATAEELILNHLGLDIRKPDLWRQSLSVVEQKIARLEKLMTRHCLSEQTPASRNIASL